MRDEWAARVGLESAQLATGGHVEALNGHEGDADGDGEQQEEGRRDADDDHNGRELGDPDEQQLQLKRDRVVQSVHVLREAVQHAARRRRVEEQQRRVHQTFCAREYSIRLYYRSIESNQIESNRSFKD